MTEMKLTKMQIEYLLFLNNNPRKRTITDASKYFDCSKVNAKKNNGQDVGTRTSL